MAAKVAEADAGVHTLAMSVAVCTPQYLFVVPFYLFSIQPVTSWLLYGAHRMFEWPAVELPTSPNRYHLY